MDSSYFPKNNKSLKKTLLKIIGILFMISGISIFTYVFFPLISWQIYFAPEFEKQNITAPIPKYQIVTDASVGNLFQSASKGLTGVDYTNASNWFPNYKFDKNGQSKLSYYTISIPKIKVKNAIVSSIDTNLSKHLVNYSGTALPPERGNAVIFGHSTLPLLYNPKDYKTVFTNLYKLTTGDEIVVSNGDIDYKYKVEQITVVDPENTTVLEQNYDSSFITLITCTPPGTIWKRLVVKARIENI